MSQEMYCTAEKLHQGVECRNVVTFERGEYLVYREYLEKESSSVPLQASASLLEAILIADEN